MKKLLTSGYSLIIFSSLALSFKGVLVKVGYNLGTDPMALMLMRLYVAVPCFIITLIAMEGKKAFTLRKDEIAIFAFMGIGGMGSAMVCSFKSLELIDASINIVITYTYPAITAIIMALFFGERIGIARMFSLVVTFFGLALVVRADQAGMETLKGAEGMGAILALASAFLYALYNIAGQNAMKRISPLRISAYGTIFLTAFYGGILGVRPYPANLDAWGLAAILGIFCGVLPFLALMYGIKAIGASQTAIISSFGPVFTSLLAYFLLGESLDNVQIGGMIMVITGIGALKLKLPVSLVSGSTESIGEQLSSLGGSGGKGFAIVFKGRQKGG